jgi:ABC-type antimicrobial peptide transport system permease subunit
LLKSIGWSNRNVVRQILVESAIQSVMGGILGCLIAVAWMLLTPAGVLGFDGISLHFSGLIILSMVGLCISFLAGFIAGVIPACWAARQEPAVMLKSL